MGVISQSDQRIELSSGASIELRFSTSEVVLTNSIGESRHLFAHPILDEAGEPGAALHSLIDEERAAGLIGFRHADRIHYFDLRGGTLRMIPTVERITGALELHLEQTGSMMLVITENGVVALDRTGCECWRIAEVTYGWRFVSESEGLLWLSDTNGNLIGIDPTTGEEKA